MCPGLGLQVFSVFISSSSHFTLERHAFKMFYFFSRIVFKSVLTLKIFNKSHRYPVCTWLSMYVLELEHEKTIRKAPRGAPGRPFLPAPGQRPGAPAPFPFAHTCSTAAALPFWMQASCLPQDWKARWPKAQRWPRGHQIPLHVSFTPVVVESEFVKYEGKSENHMSGSIETALGKVTLNARGKGLVESQSSFGTLRKQEVDLQQLLRDAVER